MQDHDSRRGHGSIQGQLAPFVLAMALVVVASNYLVQYPVQASFGELNLADLLTWGAFTYPVAFLVTDLANRRLGAFKARIIVFVGFLIAVLLSVLLATPRIAVASGSAFIVAQLLDVSIFDRLRHSHWWHAPLISSILGSLLDTALFFTLAFSAQLSVLGPNDPFAIEIVPFAGVVFDDMPRWMSWAIGDLCVKLLVALTMLAPYRAIIGWMHPLRTPA